MITKRTIVAEAVLLAGALLLAGGCYPYQPPEGQINSVQDVSCLLEAGGSWICTGDVDFTFTSDPSSLYEVDATVDLSIGGLSQNGWGVVDGDETVPTRATLAGCQSGADAALVTLHFLPSDPNAGDPDLTVGGSFPVNVQCAP
jgi:hypothetical protein